MKFRSTTIMLVLVLAFSHLSFSTDPPSKTNPPVDLGATLSTTIVPTSVAMNEAPMPEVISSKKEARKERKAQKKRLEEEKTMLDKALKAVFAGANFAFDDFESSDNDSGGKSLSATIDVLGEEGVSVSAEYKAERIESFEIEFPEEAKLDLDKLNNLVDGKLKAFLPDGLPLSAGLTLENFAVDFGDAGFLPKGLSTTISLAADWDIMGGFVAEGVSLDFEIEDPKEVTRQISGTLSASAQMGDIPMAISTALSSNTEDTEITANIDKLNLKNLVNSIAPQEGVAFLSATPEFFKSMELSTIEVGIKPVAKEINLTAVSSFGSVIMSMERGASGRKSMMALTPAPSFKFSDLSATLAVLDGMDFSGSHFIISDKQTVIPATFLDEEEDEDVQYAIDEGFNMVTSISLPDNMAEILKVNAVVLTGSIPLDMAGIALTAELDFGMEFLDGDLSFDRLTAGLVMGKTGLELSFGGAGSFQAGDSRVEIYGSLFLDVTSQQVGFEAGLAAGGSRVEAPDNCLAPQPEWKEPFGIPGIGIRRLGLGASVGTAFPWFTELKLDGNLRVGTVADQSNHVCGAITAVLNVTKVSESMLIAEVQNLTIINMIEAFVEDSGIEGGLRDALDTGIESAKLKIVPVDGTKAFGRTYDRGLSLDSAKLSLLGMDALLGFSIGEDGIKAYGSMDPFIVEEGGFTFFAIKGAKDNPDGTPTGPEVSLGMDPNDPHFKLSGSITLLEIERETFVRIDKSGFEFKTSGGIADGALGVSATVSAGEFTKDSGLYAEVEFENKLQTMVADALLDFIEEESKKSQETYKEAQKVLAETKGSNDFEQFWIDAAGETVTAFKELDKGMAVAGAYVVEGLLKDALNIRKLSFEGEVTSMNAAVTIEIDMTIAGSDITEKVTMKIPVSEEVFVDLIVAAVGDDVIDFFASLDTEIANAFEDLGAELETAFEDLGNYIIEGAEIVGEGIITGAEYVGDALTDAAEEVETFFVGSTDSYTVSNGTAVSEIPVNSTHYKIKINNIKVTGGEGGIYPGLELFGGILVLPVGVVSANEGATPYAFSRSERDSKEISVGSSISVNHVKDFYFDNDYLAGAQVSLLAAMGDFNTFGGPGGDSEKITGVKPIIIGQIPVGQEVDGSFTATDGDGETISVSYTILGVRRRGPIPTPQQMQAAVAYGNVNEINRLVSDGGSLRASGMIEAAITGNVNQNIVLRLLQEGNIAKTSQVELALNPSYYNTAIASMLLQNGARASSDALLSVVNRQDLQTANLLYNYGARPKLEHVQLAIKNNDVNMVTLLMDMANVQVGENELLYAVNRNDLTMANLFMYRGAEATPVMITSAVNAKNIELVKALMTTGTPDPTALQAAANINDPVFFDMVSKRVSLTSNGPINTAINNNNMEILNLALRRGGSKSEALRYAISKQNKQAIYTALRAGANGTPALEFAVSNNDSELYKALLSDYGANPTSALNNSYDKNNFEFGTIAMEFGGDPNQRITTASNTGKTEWVKAFLKYKANPQPALQTAVDNKHIDVVRLLIDAGAKADKPSYMVNPSTVGDLEMIKLLVEKGEANPEHGRNYAISNNQVNTLRYLLEQGANATGLGVPAQNGWIELVKLLLEFKADPNEGMPNAFNFDKADVAILLLDAGADPKDYIKMSATKGNVPLTAKLLEKGADPNDGRFNAARYRHVNIMQMLIDAGADVTGEGVMDAAVVNFQLEMVELLLANGGDTKFVTKKEETYLHRVADKDKNDLLVKAFIAAGLDLEAKNKNGETPLHLAARGGNDNLRSVVALVEAGANVNALDRKARTVLRRAKGKKVKDYLEDNGAVKKISN